MRLKNITATPHPNGNRIDLKWENPEAVQYPGVRVVRHEGTHPTSPEDGVLVAEGEGLNSAVDENLKGEAVYYYALFPYKGAPPEYQIDRHNRTSAMATAPYNTAGQMYDLLPAIYHRYDTVLPKTIPDGMSEADAQKGQLRRFLDLPGSQVDALYSFAKAMLELHNIDKVDGHLLPLLAEWIGWKTDYNLDIAAQRNEIRNAPSVYKTIGLIPTVEATIKRISGWESRTKEFVHNVFLSNRPERLNLWARQRSSTGEWSAPTEPLSLNFAYEGRPAAVRAGDGTLWLFYHTLKKGRWEVWYKTLSTFTIASAFQSDLEGGAISIGLQQAFADEGFSLSLHPTIEKKGSEWLLTDTENGETYAVREENGQLNVYRWAPSQPLTNRAPIDKHPTAVVQGETLWVFWGTYDENEQKWHINHRTQTDSVWSSIETTEPFADTTHERKTPWAVVDNAGGLWLFWLEKVGAWWQMKYNRHDGTAWELASAPSFPLDAGEDPRVESDLYVLFHPTDANQPLWVFWARKVPTGAPEQTRWTVAYRVKQGIDPSVSDWEQIRTLPQATPDDNDREPAAIISADGNIEIFWSSNRGGSWSIWRNPLDTTAHTWGAAKPVTENLYSQRAPLPLATNTNMTLIYRSNESIPYSSKVYGATETVDFRYAGCTTVDTRNAGKITLRGLFEDFQTYTYDTQRTNDDWYARDTVGSYLTPDTDDARHDRKKNLIQNVLQEFLPIQVRAVFRIQQVYNELVYTYVHPETKPQHRINERMIDTILSEVYRGLDDSFIDVAGFRWLRTYAAGQPLMRLPDLTVTPPDLSFRLFWKGVTEGE